MDARRESEPTPMKNRTTVERKSERELVVTRTFDGPARIVFEAWTRPELFANVRLVTRISKLPAVNPLISSEPVILSKSQPGSIPAPALTSLTSPR